MATAAAFNPLGQTSALSPVNPTLRVAAYSGQAAGGAAVVSGSGAANSDTVTISIAGLELQLQAMQTELAQLLGNGQLNPQQKQAQTAQLNAQIATVQEEIAQAQEQA